MLEVLVVVQVVSGCLVKCSDFRSPQGEISQLVITSSGNMSDSRRDTRPIYSRYSCRRSRRCIRTLVRLEFSVHVF